MKSTVESMETNVVVRRQVSFHKGIVPIKVLAEMIDDFLSFIKLVVVPSSVYILMISFIRIFPKSLMIQMRIFSLSKCDPDHFHV